MKKNKIILDFVPLGILLIILLGGSMALAIFSESRLMDLVTFSFALLFYAFFPGYCILLNFEVDKYQRLAFSVPLSIVLVALSLYLINVWLAIPINRISIISIITFFSAIGILWPKIKGKIIKYK